MELKGIIFDLDGVITQTARVHFKAWKNAFEAFLKKHSDHFKPFTYENDYLPYVDGMPRYQGVESFLHSRNIDLPFGDPNDEPGFSTICALGNKKNEAFRAVVEEEGVDIYEQAIRFIEKAKKKNLKLAVASSSKNCKFILEKSGLIDYFQAVVGGIKSKEMDLKGKPDPDIFVTAAELIGLAPVDCMVVEDAISGVQAGRNGSFGLVLGISRSGDKSALYKGGADFVIEYFDELSFNDIDLWFKEGIEHDSWNLSYNYFDPMDETLREALTTVGNGYAGNRGAFESVVAEDDVFYPGTYIAGLFNKIPTRVHDRDIYNNDFVNIPNWTLIQFKTTNDADFVALKDCHIMDYRHNLDVKKGIVSRWMIIEDKQGKQFRITSERLMDMAEPHIAGISFKIMPLNFSGEIQLRSFIDGSVINYGVPRYRKLNGKHLDIVDKGTNDGQLYLQARTNQSNIDIYVHASNRVRFDAKREIEEKDEWVAETITFNATQDIAYELEKLVSIYTSKDLDVSNVEEEARHALDVKLHYPDIKERSAKAWEKIWQKVDIRIDGDRYSQKITRLHIYHLLCTASPNNLKIDAGMPARGLHGEAYRGHIFWDELYILPFYFKHFPDVAKSLLMYRYRRLDDARKYAKNNGFQGAMYPWQTADTGEEETQEIHYNPVSDTWGPDLSRRQRHVSIAVAYNVLCYYDYTQDKDFLSKYGGEMLIEIARFWASIAEKDETTGKYHINGVMGPDEFHEKYPGASDEEGGVNDNAYTNIMVSWFLNKVKDVLPEIGTHVKQKTGFNENKELNHWMDIARNLYVQISDYDILSQYDGYFNLDELNWEYYEYKYPDYHRMDRILKSEGDSPDHYKVAKQADALMPFFLIPPEEVVQILNTLGNQIKDPAVFLRKNYDYYIKRTSHGSTLSYIVHAYILKYLDVNKKVMWDWFVKALRSDVDDVQGGTTPEGIHCGVMAGTLEIIYNSFAGIEVGEKIKIMPNLPAHWKQLSFNITYRNEIYRYTIDHQKILIESIKGKSMTFVCQEKEYKMNEEGRILINY